MSAPEGQGGQAREMTHPRKCSHCGNNGHNSRTCPTRGVRIFGVRLLDGPIRKSVSTGNLTHFSGGGDGAPDNAAVVAGGNAAAGYVSDNFAHGNASGGRERKKGVPWTEDEHKMFLVGLKKLGKGDWRGIARSYVVTRTPTQVASHAQKYYIRQTHTSRRKRRSSLFDIVSEVSDKPVDVVPLAVTPGEPDTQGNNPLPLPARSVLDERSEPMSYKPNSGEGAVLKPDTMQFSYPLMYPTAYVVPYYPVHYPVWPTDYYAKPLENKTSGIVKPTALHRKAPICADELGGMSKLTLRESIGDAKISSMSLKLPDGSERQSAFHAKLPDRGTAAISSINAIPAV